MKIKLSVLIPSVHTRRSTFLPKALEMIYGQYEQLSPEQQAVVEILTLVDNKKMMLGAKRNTLIDIAQGEYIVFVDDDDRIEPDYLTQLLEAIEYSGADCIAFLASVSINGGKPRICRYSKDFGKDYNTPTEYHRIPNHICCVKKSVSLKSSFPNIKYQEDAGYSKVLLPHISSEYKINKVLYHYDFNEQTTETQEHIAAQRIKKNPVPSVIDVVFLSRASNAQYRQMTQTAIDTCIRGANGLSVNCIVIEQEPNIIYDNAVTVYHDAPFRYNAFMNLGARQGTAPWIMFANNDLVFSDGFAHELIGANNPVVSPFEPNDPRHRQLDQNEKGYQNGRNLCGWCFMMKREVWAQIGGLDEDFKGWFADDAVIEQVRRIGIAPMLVKNAVVKHLGSKTLNALPQDERDELCWSQLELFNRKYNQNKFHDNPHYKAWQQRSKK